MDDDLYDRIAELVGSLLILPPSMQTSATYIYAQFEQGKYRSGWRWPSSRWG
ncbi:hypothetical protein VQ056_12380 [Paenibacillus sp. JTLBN-2024]